MVYSFARVSAVVGMRVEDYYQQGKRWWLRLQEKGGKHHAVPVHHKAEAYLDAYLAAAGMVLLQGLGSRARIRWVDLVTRPIRTPCGSAASARPRRPSPSIAPVPCGAHA